MSDVAVTSPQNRMYAINAEVARNASIPPVAKPWRFLDISTVSGMAEVTGVVAENRWFQHSTNALIVAAVEGVNSKTVPHSPLAKASIVCGMAAESGVPDAAYLS